MAHFFTHKRVIHPLLSGVVTQGGMFALSSLPDISEYLEDIMKGVGDSGGNPLFHDFVVPIHLGRYIPRPRNIHATRKRLFNVLS